MSVQDIVQDAKRGTGRTTRLVLQYVQDCMDHVGDEVKIFDHKYGDNKYYNPTQHSNLMVANKVSAILTALNVQHYVNSNAVCVLPINV